MKDLKLYNSLTRKKEEFIPIDAGEVKMYNCGPTVYNYIHVGNARPLVVFDTLRRYFNYRGLDVKFVVNFTDIDDKIINRANEEGTTARAIADKYIEEFKKDANGLNLYDYDTINPRATEYIQPMIDFIQGLVDKDVAYEAGGDVYFDITKAEDYGKLSGKNIDDLMSGARIAVNEIKRNPGDFVLWKGKKEGEPAWESPWGEGRPGWHIECSVMAKTILGDTIDIHSGGEDLQFPHHENEIAQSETRNEKPFANYWLHNGMITVDGTKMSKSLGNFFTLREVSEVFDLEVLRLFLISAHYRSPINYSYDVMEQTKAGLDRLYAFKDHLERRIASASEAELSEADKALIEKLSKFKDEFIENMDDDLNTAGALGVLYSLVRTVNAYLAKEEVNQEVLKEAYKLFMEICDVFGILDRDKSNETNEEIDSLIEERNQARKEKNFARADEIRDQLLDMGISIEDTREGTIWRRI